MEDSLKKLSLLIEKCVQDNDYRIKNNSNFINGYINDENRKTKIEKAYEVRKNYMNYEYGQAFNVSIIEDIKSAIEIQENICKINSNYLELSIDDISKRIDNIIDNIDSFNNYINRSNIYIERIEAGSGEKINNDYIFTKEDFIRFRNLLIKRIREMVYENYDIEYLNFIMKKVNLLRDKKIESVDFYIYLYNDSYYKDNNIKKENKTIKIIKSEEVTYIKSKSYAKEYEEDTYYVNFNKDEVFKSFSNMKIINAKNYEKFLDLKANTNLLDNAKINIQSIFGKYIKDTDYYLVSANAYYSAILDIKIDRGKKRCLVCGEKLGFIEKLSEITCNKHRSSSSIL